MRNVRLTCRFSWILITLLFMTGGCLRNINPILKDDQVVPNDALVGKWVSADGKGFAELKKAENGQYPLICSEKDGKKAHFTVRFGKIGAADVAEIKADSSRLDDSAEFRSLLLPLYTVAVIQKTTPNLVLTGPSVEWMKKYTQAHADELDVLSIPGSDIIVIDSTANFQAFFTRHLKDPGMLGDDQFVYVHPGDPSTQPAAGGK